MKWNNIIFKENNVYFISYIYIFKYVTTKFTIWCCVHKLRLLGVAYIHLQIIKI